LITLEELKFALNREMKINWLVDIHQQWHLLHYFVIDPTTISY
jgi:hypothetical protein